MSCKIQRILAIFLFFALIATPAWSDVRSENAREAIAKIALGRYDEAGALISQILARDGSDPLGHMSLGIAFLHTGKLPEAKVEFQRVLSVWPNNWQSRYALGLIALMESRRADAEKHFAYVESIPSAASEMASLRTYMAFVRDTDAPSTERGDSLLAKQTEAMAAIKAGRIDDAKALLSKILETPAPPGFADTRAVLATFVREKPIAVPGGRFTWKPVEQKDARVVSGSIALKADATQVSDISFVNLFVDDKCVSVTNYSPFEFSWDTTKYPNGLHSIKIEAKGPTGSVVSSKSVVVRVANATSASSRTEADDAELVSKLWEFIRLGAARKSAHYQLAKQYMRTGDRKSAITELEYVVAADPSFLDARSLLNTLRGWGRQYAEAWRGKPGGKMVALTFDDGPNERTAEMVDVLTKLKVPATFFVVGFRAEQQPELIRAMQSAGHEIENHSYTHTNLTTLNADEVELELSRNAAVVHSITGREVRYFRPPGGHANAATREAAARQGFTGVFWTVLCSPYEGSRYVSMADHVINNACDGAIILMHNGEPATTSSLPRIVSTLRSKGYRFVTLAELLASGTAPPLKATKR